MAYNTVTVSDTATEIVPANTKRRNVTLSNVDTSVTVYIGPDSSITTSNAIPLYAFQTRDDKFISEGYQGPIYGIVASGTVDVRYWEVENV